MLEERLCPLLHISTRGRQALDYLLSSHSCVSPDVARILLRPVSFCPWHWTGLATPCCWPSHPVSLGCPRLAATCIPAAWSKRQESYCVFCIFDSSQEHQKEGFMHMLVCRSCLASRDPYCGWTRGSTCSFLRPGTRWDHAHKRQTISCIRRPAFI